jgi:DNA-binding response OmpR family regulator
MRYPRVLVYENDGRIARLLRDRSEPHNGPHPDTRLRTMLSPAGRPAFWLLEPRRPEACLRILRRGGPAVVVLRVGRDLVRELSLMEQVREHWPESPVIVVGDSEDVALADLSWDLGADYVLMPPQPREQLPAVVAGLMKAAVRHQWVALGQGDGPASFAAGKGGTEP